MQFREETTGGRVSVFLRHLEEVGEGEEDAQDVVAELGRLLVVLRQLARERAHQRLVLDQVLEAADEVAELCMYMERRPGRGAADVAPTTTTRRGRGRGSDDETMRRARSQPWCARREVPGGRGRGSSAPPRRERESERRAPSPSAAHHRPVVTPLGRRGAISRTPPPKEPTLSARHDVGVCVWCVGRGVRRERCDDDDYDDDRRALRMV